MPHRNAFRSWMPLGLSAAAILGAGGFAVTVAARERASAEEAVALARSVAAARVEAVGPGAVDTSAELATELAAELQRERARVAELEAQVAELEAELSVSQTERLDREMQWLDFTSAVATLDIDTPGGEFARELLSEEPGLLESEEPPDPAVVARAERSAEMQRVLRALLAAEWVEGIDLIDIGRLSDEGWIGPVVFRMLDDRGRLSGSLMAQRMRLEGSKSGRVVTIVLEEGEERHEGVGTPFRGGFRRILLPGIDPVPFIEGLPELFTEKDARGELDDGLWDARRIVRELCFLLDEDATGDVYRVRHIGAVRGTVMHDVHLEVRNRTGQTRRHLFADSMRVSWGERGVIVELEDGVTMRGDSRAPFLEGRYRIFLPRARREAWAAASIPGLSPPPSALPVEAGG